MLPFEIVETPTQPPYGCLFCGSVHDLIDTRKDIDGIGIPNSNMVGRVYMCRKVCAKQIARTAGFAPGKNLDRLADAAAALELAELNAARDREERDALAQALENAKRDLKKQAEELDQTHARAEHLRRSLAAEIESKQAVLDAA